MKPCKTCHLLIVIAMLLVQAGCSSTPPSRLYLLEPLAGGANGAGNSKLTIAVSRVALPEYLKRQEILTQEQQFRVSAAGFDRWAGPLDHNIGNVIAENLSALMATDRVLAYPWDTTLSADFNLRIRVIQFNANPSGQVELKAAWLIQGKSNSFHKASYRVAQNGEGPVAIVAAMSRAIELLSRDIANELKLKV